ncbi:MAG: hypothetical protein ABH863_04465, partial [Candidatus Micrarchaeota archaeon]
MRPILFIFFVLPGFAAAFSQFSYLFPESEPASLYSFLIIPKDCGLLNFKLEPMARSDLPPDMPQLLLEFDSSLTDIGNARKIARYIPFPVYSSSTPQSAISLICYKLAVNSVNHASRAMRLLLSGLDSKYAALDILQGDEDAFSSGISAEFGQLEGELSENKAQSEFSSKILGSSANLTNLWREFPSNLENFRAISEIMGKEGALREAAILAEKIDMAAQKLQDDHMAAGRLYNEMLLDAESRLDAFKTDKLTDVKFSEAVYSSGIASTGLISKSSFFEMGRESERLISEAKKLHILGEKAFSAKQRGYVAYSLNKDLDAMHMLSQSSTISDEAQLASTELEWELETLSIDLEAKSNAAIMGKTQEPLVYNYLNAKMEEFKRLKAKSSLPSPRGLRINLLSEGLSMLEDLLNAAGASDLAAFALAKIRGKIRELDSLLDNAKKDKLDVSGEEQTLLEVQGSLKSIRLESDLPLLQSTEKSLDAISGSLESKALDRYSYLDGIYADLAEHVEFLPVQDAIKLESYSRFVDGGRIDALQSLGQLYQFEQFLLKESEEFDSKKPKLLADHLESMLVISEVSDPMPPGTPTAFTAFVSMENLMDFFAPNTMVPLPLPADSVLLNSTGGILLVRERGGLFLLINEEKKRYSASLQFELIPNSVLSVKDEFLHADAKSLQLRRSVKFKTSRRSEMIFETDPFGGNFIVDYSGPHQENINAGKLAIILDAYPGTNTLSIDYAISDPFDFNQNILSHDDTSVVLELSYANIILDLPATELLYDGDIGCDVSKLQVLQSDFEFSDLSRGEFLSFRLKAKEWPFLAKKRITLKLICNNRVSELLLAGISGDIAPLDLASQIEAAKTEQLLSIGDYDAVLKEILASESASSAISNLESRLAALETVSIFMLEKDYEADYGNSLRDGAENARNLLIVGRTDEALAAISKAESGLKSFLEEKLRLSKKKCTSDCSASLASSIEAISLGIIAKDYEKALAASYDFDLGYAAEGEAKSFEDSQKIEEIAQYPDLIPDYRSSLEDFNYFFFTEEESRSDLYANLQYRSAVSAKTALEKAMKDLALIDNAVNTGNSEKYSPGLISEKVLAAKDSLALLQTSNSEIRRLAEEETSQALRRQTQFGDDSSQEMMRTSQSELASGHYFMAYIYAKGLNSSLFPKEDAKPWDLGFVAIPTVALLLGLSYYFLFIRGKNEAA